MGMRWQDWMNILVGLWLIASPLIMAYTNGFFGLPAWNSYLFGLALIIVPLLGLARPLPQREWVVLAIGVWLIISPFLLGFAEFGVSAWNTGICGVVVAIGAGSALRARGKGPRGA